MTDGIHNIKIKIFLPFFSAIALVLAAVFWNLYLARNEIRQFNVSISDKKLQNLFEDGIQQESERLKGFVHFFQSNDETKQLWLNRDRKGLTNTLKEKFDYLKEQYKITHFYFHDLDGKVFLRVHAPQKHGDTLKRKTFLAAKSSKQTSAGIEFGVFGEFVLRVVSPWTVDGELIGYIELGEEINHILERIASTSQSSLVLSIDKEYLKRENLLDTSYFQTRSIDIVNYENQVIISKTIERLDSKIVDHIDHFLEYGPTEIKIDNNINLISQVPIKDITGENIARLTYLSNYTKERTIYKRYIRNSIISVVLIAAIIAIVIYFYSSSLAEYLQSVYRKIDAENESRKKVEQELIEKSQDLKRDLLISDKHLVESQQRYQTLFEKSADAFLLLRDNHFIDCNQATLDMFGYDNKYEIYRTSPFDISPEYQSDGQRSELKAGLMIEQAFKNGSHRFEWDHKRKNNEVFPVEVLLTPIPYQNTQIVHAVLRDISDRKKAAEEIEYQALYDALTGLPNRRLLFDRINQSMVAARRHNYFNALLFVDIDRFKTINDSLGHSVGDELLKESATRILSCLTKEDTASRFSGDEFVVLVRHSGRSKELASLNAEKIASRIKRELSQPYLIDKHEFHVTVSIGIALFPMGDESIEDTIKHADSAMHNAKEAGRNKISFYLSDMHEKVMHRLQLERHLRKAVKENQIKVYYQPQYSSDGKALAVEALARWIHDELGFISPDEFISIAEETGLIYELGSFILYTAVSDISKLNKTLSSNINVAVNISQKQFDKDDFVNEIRGLIENFNLNRNDLTLEVTEGLAINNLNKSIERFEELKHLGVRLSLDDFGTGYSSLSHLKRLPIDELKIDKSFVFDILDDPQDAQLVKTIISISHQFGLETVAEGVEIEEQEKFLEEQRCDIFQGYHFSKPVPLEELTRFLKKRN